MTTSAIIFCHIYTVYVYLYLNVEKNYYDQIQRIIFQNKNNNEKKNK